MSFEHTKESSIICNRHPILIDSMERLIEKLHSYLQFPEVTKLLSVRMGSDGTNPDRHSQHVLEGYKILNDYAFGTDVASLNEAIKLFHRVLTTDKKYLQALALYGNAIANGMADRFNDAQASILQLKNLNTSSMTDYLEDIEDLQHYASEEMLVDLQEAFQRLHPNEEIKHPSGCVILFFVLLSSSLLLFL